MLSTISTEKVRDMSDERIFNIFLYFNNDTARDYGVRHHRFSGTDGEKTSFLQTQVDADYPFARHFSLSRHFTSSEWLAAQRRGLILDYFEEAFHLYRAPRDPVFCITAIVDGKPKIDRYFSGDSLRGSDATEDQSMPDYLEKYTKGNYFHLTELIHDDYFIAIRLLFNSKLYVSCTKLLMSCIDTISYVEYGDTSGNFILWLNTYTDLTSQGITPDELWEYRNAVLHMTSLTSRKVLAGKVSSIVPYAGGPETLSQADDKSIKKFNIHTLIENISLGIEKWATSYASDRDKILKFIERYDLTISDSRMSIVRYEAQS